MSLSQVEFDYIRNLVRKEAAIVLEDDKMYLVESRLMPVAREAGFDNLGDFVGKVRDGHAELGLRVINAMTTNETLFFRDLHPFTLIQKTIIPELMEKRKDERVINIWNAACSSGQEPYSVSMIIHEHFPGLQNWDYRLIATDISQDILDQACAGVYGQLAVNRGLPAPLLLKYFEQNGAQWSVIEKIKKNIEFKLLNLIESWHSLPRIDLVMMRNVLIYFNADTKKQILQKVREVMKPDGYLLMGAAETTMNLDDGFERFTEGKASYYKLVNT